ncbi:MAG TPA: TonB-dependent receptor [Sphingobacterium sp.]|nr:TonB-dependent receptor [Sphingobacterium sp.]
MFLFFSPAMAQQELAISGVILDSLNQPVDGATITLFPDNKVYKTNEDGFFQFHKLQTGRYDLNVSSLNYQTYQETLDLGKDGQHIEIKLCNQPQLIEKVEVNGKVLPVDNLLRSENAAMPVKVITRREIEAMGSRRLDEVLKEQTGVAVVNDVSGGSRASGVQIQGFSSNYIMVLIDGQPLLGRNNGNFDLSRISVSNINRIEIIKGATSSLYGSDALGGTVNIITKHGTQKQQINASLLYGSLNTVDATVEGEAPFADKKGSLVVTGNYYGTDGYNTGKSFTSKGSTIAPYDNYSLQGRGRYHLNKKGTIGFSARFAQRNSTLVNRWSDEHMLQDEQKDRDVQISGNYDHHFDSGVRSMTRYFFTRYHTEMQAEWLRQNSLISTEKFGQKTHRLEQQFSYAPTADYKVTGGIGGSIETMDAEDLNEKHSLQTAFAYLQSEWVPLPKARTTFGLRYDITNTYNGQVSPSLGIEYELTPHITAKAGAGAGFKAPDYKMLYQAFYNPSANYMIVGADKIRETIEAMKNSDELSSVNEYMLNLSAHNLKAENNMSGNLGFVWKPSAKTNAEFSTFYHKIKNQIHTVSVATGTNVNQVYTYRNLPKVVNKGFEVSVSRHLPLNISLSAGYQYLVAKDLSVLDSIRADKYPYNKLIINPATGESRRPTVKDYWGLEDRSRHMFNLKILYEYTPWDLNINLRANIRGKYPFQEITTNQFIDKYDAFVPAHTLLNMTIEKKVWDRRLTLRLVADNMLNYTHQYLLGQPGRMVLGGISYKIL